jgi:putative DNA methylase
MRAENFTLPLGASLDTVPIFGEQTDKRELKAVEASEFPFEHISKIAEMESWRKEIHRPIYHLHKWWAQRLGSVFRAIVLGAFAPAKSDVLKLYSERARLCDQIVFDPFMGSGTTIGETLKLNGRAIGRDINPVACFLVRNSMQMPSRARILKTFQEIEIDVAPMLRGLYQTSTDDGLTASVLYYFWVKQADCPGCKNVVDLFSSYIFTRNAYPKKHPEAQALCPHCGELNSVRYDSRAVACEHCNFNFDAALGPARGAKAICPSCKCNFPIAAAIRERGTPPGHRLYAKLVLLPNGKKQYIRANANDLKLYAEAVTELSKQTNAFPIAGIAPGHNTDQVLKYCYRNWHQMFNARQLLGLSILAKRIRNISDEVERELFCCLFSGVLEFNNMFASFKGEGTGAVRHMFAHHILKPERMPIEANLWGTPKSSGSFSTLFRSRILRALDYSENPFEIAVEKDNKGRDSAKRLFGLSDRLSYPIANNFGEFASGRRVYLSSGNSGATDIPSQTVNAIITDPPFFDNVHYSELADFFFVWQQFILRPGDDHIAKSTRSDSEVQCADSAAFTSRLTGVWRECHRVLREDGLLIFTYHHSRTEGWRSVLSSLLRAGFHLVRVHPIKSEMSVATPKHQAKEPIDLDIVMVCRKQTGAEGKFKHAGDVLTSALAEARSQIARFTLVGRRLSRNDMRVILMSQVITALCECYLSNAESLFDEIEIEIETSIDTLCVPTIGKATACGI